MCLSVWVGVDVLWEVSSEVLDYVITIFSNRRLFHDFETM